MDKTKLRQYRALVKEEPKLEKDIAKLYERLADVPVIAGKVTKSSDDFPYIEEHMTVQMEEPKAAAEIKTQIRIKEMRLEQVEHDRTEVERFIAGIPDSRDRQIFDYSFMSDKKIRQDDIASAVGYTQGRVSQIIKGYLKD